MEYEAFITALRDCVAELCPNDSVIIEKVTKNNGFELDGIIIRKEGENVSPTMYIKDYYNKYQNGRDIDSIAAELVENDISCRDNIEVNVVEYCSYESMKDKILFKLINRDRNQWLLQKVPNRACLDMAVIYYCCISTEDSEFATWNITNDIMTVWDVTESMLFDTAMKNSLLLLPPIVKSLPEILREMMPELDEEIDEMPLKSDMYIATNTRKIFGAAVIMYPGILEYFARESGSFYVLPSSIHEVIFVPDNETVHSKELRQIVHEANETEVLPEDFLSDEIYFFDAEQKELHILNK